MNVSMDDACFAVVVFTYGEIFASHHSKVPNEIPSIRARGRIAMTMRTPEGFTARVFTTLGRRIPAPRAVESTSPWGFESLFKLLCIGWADAMQLALRLFNSRYFSAARPINALPTLYGPVHRGFTALRRGASLAQGRDLLRHSGVTVSDPQVVSSGYLAIVNTKR